MLLTLKSKERQELLRALSGLHYTAKNDDQRDEIRDRIRLRQAVQTLKGPELELDDTLSELLLSTLHDLFANTGFDAITAEHIMPIINQLERAD